MKIAVITNSESDILTILRRDERLDVTVFSFTQADHYDLSCYDTFFLLGGTDPQYNILPCRARCAIEAEMEKGKRVFAEFVESIGTQYFVDAECTRFNRMVYCGGANEIPGIQPGDLLDEQCNTYLPGHYTMKVQKKILYTDKHIPYHRHTRIDPLKREDPYLQTLWIQDDYLMICTFRLCNFIRACFGPKKQWRALVEYILKWTTGLDISTSCIPDYYTQQNYDPTKPFETQLTEALKHTLRWFKEGGILIDNGRGGMYEGYCTEIYPDGSRRLARPIRDDCIGEAIMLFGMDYLYSGNPHSLEISDNLADFMFAYMQDKRGPFTGMLRWSDAAWGVCYTHDTGRAVFGELLKDFYMGRTNHLEEITAALDFLLKTTYADGRRARRTDTPFLNEKEMDRIRKNHLPPEGNEPCAEGYAAMAMLLCWKLTGAERFRLAALRSFDTFCMGDAFQLSWAYYLTGDEQYLTRLRATVTDMRPYRHPNGGYIAALATDFVAPPTIDGEGSLVTHGGDPVVDNLYHVNWLSMGWMQAYLVTGEQLFYDAWKDITKYYIDMQIRSSDPRIDGAWTRASDMEIMEVFGIPNDVGWGPWSIESGWSLGQIGAGMACGLAAEKLRKHYLHDKLDHPTTDGK